MSILNQLKEKTAHSATMVLARIRTDLPIDNEKNLLEAGLDIKPPFELKGDIAYLKRNTFIYISVTLNDTVYIKTEDGLYYLIKDNKIIEDLEKYIKLVDYDFSNIEIFEIGDLLYDNQYDEYFLFIRHKGAYMFKSLENSRFNLHGIYSSKRDLTYNFYLRGLEKEYKIIKKDTFKLRPVFED